MCFVHCLYKTGPAIFDNNKRLIQLTVIPLSGRHCTSLQPTIINADARLHKGLVEKKRGEMVALTFCLQRRMMMTIKMFSFPSIKFNRQSPTYLSHPFFIFFLSLSNTKTHNLLSFHFFTCHFFMKLSLTILFCILRLQIICKLFHKKVLERYLIKPIGYSHCVK